MQKNNLNVIVFDDDQNVQNQPAMHKYASQSLKTINYDSKSDLISKEITSLQEKIRKLEVQGDKIKKQFSKFDANTSNMTAINPNFKELDHLLMVVQKKIQIVVQESKKILQKLTQNFDKKLQQKNKNDPTLKFKMKSQQIQKLYLQRIQQNQRQYKQQLQKVISHNKKIEQKMMQKLSFIEQKFMNKINDFQTKQKQYVEWIHHLEAKLKQNKNKKMIQITQQKPNLSKVQSKAVIPIQVESNGPSSNLQNRPNVFTHLTNVSAQNNNSRVHRKHKIFGNSSNNRSSVSPAPLQNQKQKTPNKFNNPNLLANDKIKKFSNNGEAFNTNNNNVKPENDKSWNLSNNEDAHQQNTKTNFGFSKELRSANESQFYRDVPKPGHGWDKFADIDLNDDDLQSESEDDFFYPAQSRNIMNRQDQYPSYTNNTKVLNQIPIQSRHNQQQKGNLYKPMLNNWATSSQKNNQNISQKIFSPFDLN